MEVNILHLLTGIILNRLKVFSLRLGKRQEYIFSSLFFKLCYMFYPSKYRNWVGEKHPNWKGKVKPYQFACGMIIDIENLMEPSGKPVDLISKFTKVVG